MKDNLTTNGLAPSMDPKKPDFDLVVQANQAIFEWVAWCTPALIIGARGLASGVAVSYAGRPLIITAKHVLDGVAVDKIRFIPRPSGSLKRAGKREVVSDHLTMSDAQATSVPIQNAIEGSDHEDIAALEILPSFADTSRFRFAELPPKQRSLDLGEEVLVYGFPSDLIVDVTNRRLDQLGKAVHAHAEWTRVFGRKNRIGGYDPQVNFLLIYAREEGEDVSEKPHGLSGCGVWRGPSLPRDGIWSPTATELVGIQSSWYRKAGLLKATRIEKVLDLLRRTYG
jgi:hypothetical protein